MNIGYVGLGAMGSVLVRRLLHAHEVHVYDIRPDAASELAVQGAVVADDLSSLASSASVIMLCLPTSAHVHDVLFGQEGLAKTLAPGTIVIDQTTGDPSQTRVMATELERHGCALIDAPISNDALNASAGAPTIMCGGPMAAFEEVRPVLESISLTIVYCGASGNGHLAALVDNTIALCNGLITYECAAMAVKYGLKAETVSSVINKSGGWSGASERILPALAMGDQTTNFRLELAAKDIRLSTQLGIQFGAPMVVANVVRSVIETALNQLGEQANMDGMSKVFEAMAAIKFARI